MKTIEVVVQVAVHTNAHPLKLLSIQVSVHTNDLHMYDIFHGQPQTAIYDQPLGVVLECLEDSPCFALIVQ